MRRRDFLTDSSAILASLLPIAGILGGCTGRGTLTPRYLNRIAAPLPPTRDGAKSILFGAALAYDEVTASPSIRELALTYCDIMVAATFYFKRVHPEAERFFWERSDFIVQLAGTTGALVRGHTLLWHHMLPDWLLSSSAPTASAILQHHIDVVVRHYNEAIQYWDVLNEVINPADGRSDGLRNSFWLQTCGPDYVSLALQTAHSASPTAKLGYNEYGIEDDSVMAQDKRRAVELFLEEQVKRAVPLHYFGVQAHLRAGQRFSHEHLGSFLTRLRQLGLEVVVTELDVDDSGVSGSVDYRDQVVADTYARFLDVALPAGVRQVTTWGLTDPFSWLQSTRPRPDGLPQRPLLFDDALNRKQAWDVMESHGVGLRRISCDSPGVSLTSGQRRACSEKE